MRFFFPFVLALAACTPPTTAPGPVTWHKDVAPIVQRKCATCHVAGGVAPFALGTLAEWKAMEQPALAAMRSGKMPPFPGKQDCADYDPTQAISAAQKATIETWVEEGGKEGTATEFVELPGKVDRLTRVDLSLPIVVPYQPVEFPDEYRCFLIDWPYTEPKHISGYELRPGVTGMVHHADIFYLNPDTAAEWQKRDDADPKLGWECYDIPIGQQGGWIGTFVPGNRGVDFPAGTTLKIPVGAKIYLQIHYNATASTAKPDQSTLDLRIEEKPGRLAAVMALSDPNWPTKRTMAIPAFQKDVEHHFDVQITDFASIINSAFVDGKPLKPYATTMHLHQLGQAASLKIFRKDGSTTCAVDIPKWDFHWQLAYTLKTPIVINPGDTLSVSCTFDNSAENQPVVNGVKQISKARNWGARTEDEMCVAGIYVTQ